MRNLFIFAALVFSSNSTFSQAINNPESVEYDAANERYLVSNRANPISIQALVPGQAPTLFAIGVSSPAGLEILNSKLWVCDGGSMKSFDLATGTLVDNIAVGGTFLNGITSDGTEMLYVSDFTAKKIYKINTTTLVSTEVVANTVSTPNGMWYDGTNNRVLFVNWGVSAPIKAMDLTTYAVTTVATTTLGSCDGIARDGAGNYFVSAWTQNAVYKFDANLANPVAVVTGLTQPADICYNVSNDTLVVPQTSADLVTFHNFSTASLNVNAEKLDLKLFPNPAHEKINLSFEVDHSTDVTFRISTLNGQIVSETAFGTIETGNHVFTIDVAELAVGAYVYTLEGEHFRHSGNISIVR
jgi:DNA-binding beta-propeller fold protein YncE